MSVGPGPSASAGGTASPTMGAPCNTTACQAQTPAVQLPGQTMSAHAVQLTSHTAPRQALMRPPAPHLRAYSPPPPPRPNHLAGVQPIGFTSSIVRPHRPPPPSWTDNSWSPSVTSHPFRRHVQQPQPQRAAHSLGGGPRDQIPPTPTPTQTQTPTPHTRPSSLGTNGTNGPVHGKQKQVLPNFRLSVPVVPRSALFGGGQEDAGSSNTVTRRIRWISRRDAEAFKHVQGQARQQLAELIATRPESTAGGAAAIDGADAIVVSENIVRRTDATGKPIAAEPLAPPNTAVKTTGFIPLRLDPRQPQWLVLDLIATTPGLSQARSLISFVIQKGRELAFAGLRFGNTDRRLPFHSQAPSHSTALSAALSAGTSVASASMDGDSDSDSDSDEDTAAEDTAGETDGETDCETDAGCDTDGDTDMELDDRPGPSSGGADKFTSASGRWQPKPHATHAPQPQSLAPPLPNRTQVVSANRTASAVVAPLIARRQAHRNVTGARERMRRQRRSSPSDRAAVEGTYRSLMNFLENQPYFKPKCGGHLLEFISS